MAFSSEVVVLINAISTPPMMPNESAFQKAGGNVLPTARKTLHAPNKHSTQSDGKLGDEAASWTACICLTFTWIMCHKIKAQHGLGV